MVLVVKKPSANVEDTRDVGSIPGPGRSTGVRKWHPLQCSCLGNPTMSLMGDSPWGLKRVRQRCATEQSPFLHEMRLAFYVNN